MFGLAPYAGKTAGCRRIKMCVNLRSLPAAQIMTLSLRMTTVGFCFSFGAGFVVELIYTCMTGFFFFSLIH